MTKARGNGRGDVKYVGADVIAYLQRMVEKGDVVFLVPPRTGSDKVYLKSLLVVFLQTLLDVSCNSETLGRDLNVLKGEYRGERICPMDILFPDYEGFQAFEAAFGIHPWEED